MKHRISILTTALAALAMASHGQVQSANHLVISEVGFAMPGGTEFTEIYNPTDSAVDLTNYYLTDFQYHFDLPSIVSGEASNTLSGGSDHLRKFPDGASIPSGGVAVVANKGADFVERLFGDDINNFYNQPGSPQLFETFDSDPTIPDMGTNYNMSSPDYPLEPKGTDAAAAGNMNHTDTGENAVLFYWDGNSNLISDVDMVQYYPTGGDLGTSTNGIQSKTSRPEKGPDGVANNTSDSYAPDNGDGSILTVRYPVDRNGDIAKKGMLIRRSLLEVGETHTGGNGINGDDESLENANLTWRIETGHLTNNTAGVTGLGLSSANQPPVIGHPTRDIQFPVPGDAVHISVPAYDDGTLTVKLMVDKGTGYQAINMTNEGGDTFGADINTNGLAEGTHIYWYVSATDSGNLTSTEADFMELSLREDFPGYHSFMVKTNPYSSDDLIVSEVMANPQDYDNYSHAQYFELYNPASIPLDLGGCVITTNYQGSALYPTVIHVPKGTVVSAKGYVVITAQKRVFLKNYPGIDSNLVVDFGVIPNTAFIAHAGSTVKFYGPNDFDFDDNAVQESAAFKTFTYADSPPWPNADTSTTPPSQTSGNSGYSIELKSLVPGAENDGSNWAISTAYNGTPLAANSVDSSLRSDQISVGPAFRDIVTPSDSDSIAISAEIDSTASLASVELMVKTGYSAFTATPMTLSTGTTYTAQIGPFADKTFVSYYVKATDTNNATGSFPYTAPVTSVPFYVYNVQPLGTDIIINEVMANSYGSDNNNYPEFIELYNRSNEDIDMSYYYFGQELGLTSKTGRIFPRGTTIQAHGYLVLTPNGPLFKDNYFAKNSDPSFFRSHGFTDESRLIDLAYSVAGHIGNAGGPLYLTEPNHVDFFSTENVAEQYTLTYANTTPWPTDLDGHSIELIDPALNGDDGNNWVHTEYYAGTPGHFNSTITPPSDVSDWTLY